MATSLGREFVIQAKGEVVERQAKNPKMPTGDIEIKLEAITILNKSVTPPFTIEEESVGIAQMLNLVHPERLGHIVDNGGFVKVKHGITARFRRCHEGVQRFPYVRVPGPGFQLSSRTAACEHTEGDDDKCKRLHDNAKLRLFP